MSETSVCTYVSPTAVLLHCFNLIETLTHSTFIFSRETKIILISEIINEAEPS